MQIIKYEKCLNKVEGIVYFSIKYLQSTDGRIKETVNKIWNLRKSTFPQ